MNETFGIWDALQRERGEYRGKSTKCECHAGCRLLAVVWPDNEETEVCSTLIAPIPDSARHLVADRRYRANDHFIKHA